jgi:hypothetical protein
MTTTYIPSGLLVTAMREVASQIAGQAQGTSNPWSVAIDPSIVAWLVANLPANTIMGNYLAAELQAPHQQTVQAQEGQLPETMGEIWTV